MIVRALGSYHALTVAVRGSHPSNVVNDESASQLGCIA